MEGMLSELDYFEPQVMQMSVVAEYDRYFNPIQTIVDGGPVEFFIRGADGLYCDLNNSKLEVKLKITKENGADLVVGDHVGPINDVLNSMFMSIEMEMNNVLITDPNTKYPFRAVIENLINFNKLIFDTRLLAEGWTKDTAGKMTDSDPEGENTGLAARTAWFARSAVVTLIGRPHLDLFHQDKLIPAGIDLKFRFLPNKHEFLLKTAAPEGDAAQARFKLKIESMRLFIRTKEISPSLILAHEKMLQKTNYSILYNKITTKTVSIPNGTSNIEFDNIYMGKLPDLIVMAMTTDTDMAGGYQRNPFNFQHFGVNYLCLKANGEQIPRIALQPNFATKDYIRAYFGVLESLGFDIGPNCWDIKPEEWANGYSIFAFKITPGPIGTVHSPSRVGAIRLELKFSANTASNINVLLLAQQTAELQIDKYKNVQLI